MQITPRPFDQTVMMIAGCLPLHVWAANWRSGTGTWSTYYRHGAYSWPIRVSFYARFVALRPYLYISFANAWLFCGLTIVSFYCNFIGISLTVITGAGADMYLPPWGSYVTDSPSAANFWVGFTLNMSSAALLYHCYW